MSDVSCSQRFVVSVLINRTFDCDGRPLRQYQIPSINKANPVTPPKVLNKITVTASEGHSSPSHEPPEIQNTIEYFAVIKTVKSEKDLFILSSNTLF